MRKDELRKILEEAKEVYCVGIEVSSNSSWDRGLWHKFRFFIIKDNKLVEIRPDWEDEIDNDIPSYWIPKHQTKSGKWIGGYFKCNTIGADRVYEIYYAICVWLNPDKPYSLIDNKKLIFLNY